MKCDTLFIYSQHAAVNSLGEIIQIEENHDREKGDYCGDKGRSLSKV